MQTETFDPKADASECLSFPVESDYVVTMLQPEIVDPEAEASECLGFPVETGHIVTMLQPVTAHDPFGEPHEIPEGTVGIITRIHEGPQNEGWPVIVKIMLPIGLGMYGIHSTQQPRNTEFRISTPDEEAMLPKVWLAMRSAYLANRGDN